MIHYIVWAVSFIREDPQRIIDKLWRRLAFASRYGNQQLLDLLDLDEQHLAAYCRALSQILTEENTPSKRR